MAEVKGFTFGEGYYTTISDPENGLSEEQKAQLYKAMIDYIFAGKIPEFKGVLKVVFSALLPSLEKSKVRSKAKQNKIKSKTKQNQNEIKKETKTEFDFVEEKAPSIKEKEGQKENITTPKEDILSPPIIPQNGQAKFFELYPSVIIDNYDPSVLADLSDSDWETIIEQFEASEWLRTNIKTTTQLCKRIPSIIAGCYAPFVKVPKHQDSAISAAERRENEEWFEKNFGRGE